MCRPRSCSAASNRSLRLASDTLRGSPSTKKSEMNSISTYFMPLASRMARISLKLRCSRTWRMSECHRPTPLKPARAMASTRSLNSKVLYSLSECGMAPPARVQYEAISSTLLIAAVSVEGDAHDNQKVGVRCHAADALHSPPELSALPHVHADRRKPLPRSAVHGIDDRYATLVLTGDDVALVGQVRAANHELPLVIRGRIGDRGVDDVRRLTLQQLLVAEVVEELGRVGVVRIQDDARATVEVRDELRSEV